MMPAGKYYVGDLCYVLHNEWNEVCDLFFNGRTDHGCNEGEFNLKDGRRFACYNTVYGDGQYWDEDGRSYSVDAGSIGCILIDDIDMMNEQNFLDGGNIVDFHQPFKTDVVDGVIKFGDIRIDTDPIDLDEDYEE